MSPSFALWLVGILVVVTGLVIWRVLAGGRTKADSAAPIMEVDATTATGDQERHAPIVDEVPPLTAVTEEPAPAQQDATPTTAAPVAETAAVSTDAAGPADSALAEAEQPHAEAEPAATEAEQPAVQAEPVTVEAEVVSTEAEPVAADVEPATAPAEPDAPASVPAPRGSVENSTAAAAEPADGPADDFQKIQGIGPKMAAGLQGAGIRTYQQLAELDEAALRDTIKAAGLRAAPGLATWPQQAKTLAEAAKVLPAGADA